MAKFVQEGLYLAQGEEGWLLGCWLGEVHHHAYVWTNVNALMVNPLSLEFCHPGTALLALAREEVGIEYGEIAAVLVEYLVCLHVWMVYRNILVLLEGDAVELVGKTEYAVYHLVELEVWAEHLCIQVILLHLQLVGSMDNEEDEPEIIKRADNGGWLVDGQCSLYDLLCYFDCGDLYEASGYHTLAGLILDRLQRIPRSGEKLEWNSFVFEIMDMDGARIDKVLVTRSVG